MDINELKRELSKVSGVDFFNPKYREIFKKYFSADEEEDASIVDETVDEEEINAEVEDIDEA